VIGEPPSLGALQLKSTCWLPGVAVKAVTWPGPVDRVTLLDASDATEVNPAAFVTVNVQVYAFPAVSDDTTTGEPTPVFDPLAPPSLETQATVYGVAANVVNPDPAVLSVTDMNATDTEPTPAVTLGAAGLDGVVYGIADAGVVGPHVAAPAALYARTWR